MTDKGFSRSAYRVRILQMFPLGHLLSSLPAWEEEAFWAGFRKATSHTTDNRTVRASAWCARWQPQIQIGDNLLQMALALLLKSAKTEFS